MALVHRWWAPTLSPPGPAQGGPHEWHMRFTDHMANVTEATSLSERSTEHENKHQSRTKVSKNCFKKGSEASEKFNMLNSLQGQLVFKAQTATD